MVIELDRIKKIGEIKQNAKNIHLCPQCGDKIEIGVEFETLKELNDISQFPYPHIHLHGEPLHAMLCYIDKHMTIRSITVIKSVEISRNSETFMQLMRKWTNPF